MAIYWEEVIFGMKVVWRCSENQQFPYSSLIAWLSTFFGLSWYICHVRTKRDGMANSLTICRSRYVLYNTMSVYRSCGWTFEGKPLLLFIFQSGSSSFLQWMNLKLFETQASLVYSLSMFESTTSLYKHVGRVPTPTTSIASMERKGGFQSLSFQTLYCHLSIGPNSFWLIIIYIYI